MKRLDHSREFSFLQGVNLEKQFLFIHIPRTGGTTLRNSTPEFRQMNRLRGGKHWSWSMYALAKPREFRRFFKFCFVRNPWDRLVSAYHFFLRPRAGKAPKQRNRNKRFLRRDKVTYFRENFEQNKEDFSKFVETLLSDVYTDITVMLPQVVFVGKPPVVDFVGRFESLEEDYLKVCEKVGSTPSPLDLDSETGELTLDRLMPTVHDPYQEYYDENTKKIVAEVYKDDIEAFGYTFE